MDDVEYLAQETMSKDDDGDGAASVEIDTD